MNLRTISLILVTLASGIVSTKADTSEEFLSTYRTALEQKAPAKLLSLYYTNGCSAADVTLLSRILKFNFNDQKIKDVTFQPLPEGLNAVNIMDGKKYEPTYASAGVIKIVYEPKQNGLTSLDAAYAVIDGKHYLITQKSTDLGWKGPKDQQLNFMVMGQGQDKLSIQYKWNASGITQERTITTPSIVFMGQYIDSIDVTSTEDNTDVTLTVRESGKDIYTSQPLKGKGTLEYKRKQ